MIEYKRKRSCSKQVIRENLFRLELLACLMSGWVLIASISFPAAAADGFALQVFGNANMDDRIDESDLNYAQRIVSGKEKSTELVDAGGNNLGENLNSTTGSAEVDREWVMSQNPDVIIGSINQAANKSGYSADEKLAFNYMRMMHEKILSDDAINETVAAANARVYLICGDLNTGPMQAAGTAFMAKILHPELFDLTSRIE